jgi:hypothetical protein
VEGNNLAVHKADAEATKSALAKAQTLAKEEEEKRVKAVSLLKTVRQKLVRVEKEKEEALSALQELKSREQDWSEKGQAANAQLAARLAKSEADAELALKEAKRQWEKESTLKQTRLEQEHIALKGQLELELVTVKVHVIDISSQFHPHTASGCAFERTFSSHSPNNES